MDSQTNDAQPHNIIKMQLEIIINNLSNLATKEDISNMTAGINSLTQEVKHILEKLLELEPRLVAAENTIASVVDDVKKLKQGASATGVAAIDIIYEISDRSNRARNLIIYNVPESSKPLQKKKDEKYNITCFFNALQFEGEIATFYRLGKNSGTNKIRPFKSFLKHKLMQYTSLKYS